jgi:hypothetical protein
MQYLTKSEQDLYNRVTAAIVGAKADEALKQSLVDGPSFAHTVQDAAMDQVLELRTRVRAARLRKQRRAR